MRFDDIFKLVSMDPKVMLLTAEDATTSPSDIMRQDSTSARQILLRTESILLSARSALPVQAESGVARACAGGSQYSVSRPVGPLPPEWEVAGQCGRASLKDRLMVVDILRPSKQGVTSEDTAV